MLKRGIKLARLCFTQRFIGGGGKGGRGDAHPPCKGSIITHIKPRNRLNMNNKSIQNLVPESAPEAISGSPKCENFLAPDPLEIVCLLTWKMVLPSLISY